MLAKQDAIFVLTRFSVDSLPLNCLKNRVCSERVRGTPANRHPRLQRSRETAASSGGRNRAWERCRLIHPLGAPWPPRSIQDKLLIAISESRKSRRNSLRYPVNAG